MTPDSLSSGALGVPPEPEIVISAGGLDYTLDELREALEFAATEEERTCYSNIDGTPALFRALADELVRLRASLAAVSEERDAPRELFIVGSGEYEQYDVVAAFTTRELAEAWAANANALCVRYAGWPGLSCQTPEAAARSYWVEEHTLSLNPPTETQWPQEWLDKTGWKDPVAAALPVVEEPSE